MGGHVGLQVLLSKNALLVPVRVHSVQLSSGPKQLLQNFEQPVQLLPFGVRKVLFGQGL